MPYRPIYSTLLDKPTVKKNKNKGHQFLIRSHFVSSLSEARRAFIQPARMTFSLREYTSLGYIYNIVPVTVYLFAYVYENIKVIPGVLMFPNPDIPPFPLSLTLK